MFGFGKALDVLRDGDAVTRNEWRPELFGDAPRLRLRAKDVREVGPGFHTYMATLVVVTGIQGEDEYERPWFPTHDDLLAEDWDYAR